jgi:hypothetical protein
MIELVGLERMLHMYFLAHWFNLSDPALEEVLHELVSMRAFVGIDLGCELVPDETTVCKFRLPLERHDLGRRLFEQVPVLIARDRMGSTANFMLESVSSQEISKVLAPANMVLCTDGGIALAAAARYLEVEHHPINLSAGVLVPGAWHVQNVNVFCSRLHAWMIHFKGVATKYLTNYLGWLTVLDRSTRFSPDPNRCSLPRSVHEFNNITRQMNLYKSIFWRYSGGSVACFFPITDSPFRPFCA